LIFNSWIDCKKLAPEWTQAARELKGKVKLGVVDATVNSQLAHRYGVQGYPTIKFFPAGHKNGQAEDYDGGRTASVCFSKKNLIFKCVSFVCLGYCQLGFG